MGTTLKEVPEQQQEFEQNTLFSAKNFWSKAINRKSLRGKGFSLVYNPFNQPLKYIHDGTGIYKYLVNMQHIATIKELSNQIFDFLLLYTNPW